VIWGKYGDDPDTPAQACVLQNLSLESSAGPSKSVDSGTSQRFICGMPDRTRCAIELVPKQFIDLAADIGVLASELGGKCISARC